MNKLNPYLSALVSGGLLSLSWPTFGFAPLVFVAFIPLLSIAEQASKRSLFEIFRSFLLAFLIWNIATTWWICKYHVMGGSLVILLNSMGMAGVMTFFALLKKKKVVRQGGFLAFISLWLSWEWVHQYWDLSWPWLNLGNAFATMPRLIQWYEFTGVFGGTLWILTVNVLCYQLLAMALEKQFHRPFILLAIITLSVILGPMTYSWQHFNQVTSSRNQIHVLVIQQNTDPKTEQDEAHAPIVRQRIAQMIEANMDSTVDLVVIPESAIIHPVCEDSLKANPDLQLLETIRQQYPNSSILVGANSYRWIGGNPPCKENYNTAFLIESSNQTGVYHKSKLVPGVERYPFAWITRPLYQWLDGADFDAKFTPDRKIRNFSLAKKGPFTVAICYESMYGDYLAQHVRKGSGFIAMITNDGWWGHSEGYRQHLAYTQLRAIETRQTIVRAANTGISAIVAPNGTLVKQTEWKKSETIHANIPLNNLQTFYVKNGDYVLRIANFASLIFLLLLLLKWLVNKKEN